MSSAIFKTEAEARKYKKYLKQVYKNNIVFTDSEYPTEVIYLIPFAIRT